VTDIPFRTILGLNQQTYQRLKTALDLNLRRQVFLAVCDDLPLRDRLAAQLQAELQTELPPASLPAPHVSRLSSATEAVQSPRVVSLHLDLTDPNPFAQIARWVTHSLPGKSRGRRSPLPSFQILGVEHLTRQSAAAQRLFLTHLQGVERSLPLLDSCLLIWLTQPWFHTLPDSAPEFWQCRTGVFEFVGDPTPLPATSPERIWIPLQQRSAQTSRRHEPILPVEPAYPLPSAAPIPAETVKFQQNPWLTVAEDLVHWYEANSEQNDLLKTDYSTDHSNVELNSSPASNSNSNADSNQDSSRLATVGKAAGKVQAELTNSMSAPNGITTVAGPIADETAKLLEELLLESLQTLPLEEQMELLNQQQVSPEVLTTAYRNLGNLYRDRIEQGEVSSQNLAIAIQAYEQALLLMPESAPGRIDLLNDLGNLYWMLSRSIQNPNQALPYLQQSIQAYQLALTQLGGQTQSSTYPMVQNNLGAAYADLARYQDPAQNLQFSIQAYQQALHYRKAETEPLRYASTQNNLGTTYWNLAQHQQHEANLKQAIAAYSEALHYYNPDQDPLNYAMIQNNLGTAYWNLAQYERPRDWLLLALAAYQKALKYRTLETAPTAFAATQNNLGTACWHLANYADSAEARLEYLQNAIAAYEATLEATAQLAASQPINFDPSATQNNLGLAHYQIATAAQAQLDSKDLSAHLESALKHHVLALQGWEQKPDLRQTALGCILQTVRAFYSQLGLPGQNLAFSKIPSSLLPELLPKL
jgi:tetratricopeptide (TPR) repeat protein